VLFIRQSNPLSGRAMLRGRPHDPRRRRECAVLRPCVRTAELYVGIFGKESHFQNVFETNQRYLFFFSRSLELLSVTQFFKHRNSIYFAFSGGSRRIDPRYRRPNLTQSGRLGEPDSFIRGLSMCVFYFQRVFSVFVKKNIGFNSLGVVNLCH